MSENKLSRREILQTATAGVIAGTMAGATPRANGAATMRNVPFTAKDKVRIGLIGVGARGSEHVRILLAIDNVELKAVCDIDAPKVAAAQKRARDAGAPEPAGYTKGERDFENLCKRDDLDLVMIATPWDWHVPMALSAMENGKHAAVEVPASFTIADCWKLVDTSEKTRRHCIQLENCCYGYNELMVWNMVKAGLFGDLTHGACAYNHDLRSILFSNEGEGQWRRFEHFSRNGNLYPTHGLGPVAHYMDINRGDRFDYLVSMSSKPASLAAYRKEHLAADDPRQKEIYREGDLNSSLIRTVKGRLITLEHNTSSPQPYDRINLIAGTKGIFREI